MGILKRVPSKGHVMNITRVWVSFRHAGHINTSASIIKHLHGELVTAQCVDFAHSMRSWVPIHMRGFFFLLCLFFQSHFRVLSSSFLRCHLVHSFIVRISCNIVKFRTSYCMKESFCWISVYIYSTCGIIIVNLVATASIIYWWMGISVWNT